MLQEHKEIMKNIIYAVETGGQVYGNKKYDDYTEAYTNTPNEHGITIGAGQWYGSEAQRLILDIFKTDTVFFRKLDNAQLEHDMEELDWSIYRPKKDSNVAKCIIKIISSDIGIQCQDKLMYEQIDEYEKEITKLGITDIKAIMMCINIRHLGGLNAVKRILNKSKSYTVDSIYDALKTDQNDLSSNTQVGDKLFWSRHEQVYKWINEKVGDNMDNYFGTVIDVANTYVGYIEKSSSENLDSKTANKGTNNYTKFSRDINAIGLMGCQAQPWCCTYQFAIEVEAYGLNQALKNWNMTKDTYVGYNCFSTYNAFLKAGKTSKTPKLGCLVIFTFSHVGRVVKIDGNTITVNEGNTSAKTYDRNGGQVAVKTYNINDPKIKGFCIIDYDKEIYEPWICTGTATCTGDDVKVRKTPNGTKLGSLYKGNRFEVDGQKDGKWIHVKVAGIGIGYIYEDYVKYDEISLPPSTIPELTIPFKDILKSDYYHDAVKWAVENTFAVGMTEDLFDPMGDCTRADALTFLWRVKGKPESKTSVNPFIDVRETDYFYKAILWAVENNIAAGVNENIFAPYSQVNRADFISFLWRFNNSPKDGLYDYNKFEDVPVNAYYYNAVMWAYKTGVTAGLTETVFGANEPCTRGQVITFLYRSK